MRLLNSTGMKSAIVGTRFSQAQVIWINDRNACMMGTYISCYIFYEFYDQW